MPVMAKKQAQPFKKGTARQPSPPLAAALRGKAAPGVASASNATEQQRALAANASQKGQAAASLASALAKKPAGPVKGNGTVAVSTTTTAVKMPAQQRSLARDLQQGKDRAPVKGAPQTRKRAYLNGGNETTNATGNARNGQGFKTFTIEGETGQFHEYIDPVTKKKRVVRVKGAVQTA